MLRRSFLVAAIAAVALVALPAGLALAAGPEAGTIVRVKLEPRASDGFEAQLETAEDQTVTLVLERGRSRVAYEVQGVVTETGLKAQFGRLGTIDVAFTPTRTLSSTPPGEECTGAPRTLREGVFTGTIEFAGERGYARLEGPQAEGTMSVISQWQCPPSEDPFLAATSRWLGPSPRKPGGERETASLHATSRRCGCFFSAGVHHRHSGGQSIFSAVKAERREGVEIIRSLSALGRASAFDYDHEAGTATLRAPRPLSGQATFERRPGRDLWRSTIRVPLLGADPLRTDGPGIRAGLYPEYHFD